MNSQEWNRGDQRGLIIRDDEHSLDLEMKKGG